jgi:hypothetical protein
MHSAQNLWRRPLALLVTLALVVTAAGLALEVAYKAVDAARQAQRAESLRPFGRVTLRATAAHRLVATNATDSLPAVGWSIRLPGWPSFYLPSAEAPEWDQYLIDFARRR